MTSLETEVSEADDLVTVQRKDIVSLVRRIQGFQNTHLVLEEKESELKKLRQKCQFFQTKLGEMQQLVRVKVKNAGTTEKHRLTKSRSAEPEVFLFPDTKQKSLPTKKNYSSLQSRSLELDGGMFQSQSMSYSPSPPITDSSLTAGKSLGTREIPLTVSGDVSSRLTGVPGVSEQYFVNLMNEMVKTKKYLHHLLQTQKLTAEDNQIQIQQLQAEIQQLKQTNSHLETTLQNYQNREENKKKNQKSTVKNDYDCDSGDDSLEFLSLKHSSCVTDSSTQTDLNAFSDGQIRDHSGGEKLQEISKTMATQLEKLAQENKLLMAKVRDLECDTNSNLKMEIKQLKEEAAELEKELLKRNTAYTDLENGVKVLGNCMQEEKKRNRHLEQELREEQQASSNMQIKLSEQLGHLREENEILRQEKRALEKQQDIAPAHSLHFSGNHGTSKFAHAMAHSPTQFASSYNNPLAAPTVPKSTPGQQHHVPSVHARSMSGPTQQKKRVAECDLPFNYNSGNTKLPHSHSCGDKVGGYDMAGPLYRAVEDSKPHQSWPCPRCQHIFSDENRYLQHLQKCLD